MTYSARVTCTGTLIAPDVVLTAAHCANGISHVLLGSKGWADDSDGEVIAVREVHEYPKHSSTYDIPVLKLAKATGYPTRTIGAECITEDHLHAGGGGTPGARLAAAPRHGRAASACLRGDR